MSQAELLAKFKSKYKTSATPNTVVSKKVMPDTTVDFSSWDEYQQVKAIETFFADKNPYCAPRQGKIAGTLEIDNQEYISFCSYNYLGMNGTLAVEKGVSDCLKVHGSSASASRVAGGECQIHNEFETKLAKFLGTEDAIVTVGGYIANVSTIRFLMSEGDLIIFDEYCHNSLVEGCASSKARRMQFRHNDFAHLESLLASQRNSYRRVLIVAESVYSMDGDIIDLANLVAIKKRHNAFLMLDEAHSIGVLGQEGKGLCQHANVNPQDIDIIMGTMSKSLASCGGFIAGSKALTGLLRYIAPGYLLYSAGIPPTSCAASLAVIEHLQQDTSRVQRLQKNSDTFREVAQKLNLDIGLSKGSPIVPIMLGEAGDTVEKMAMITRDLFSQHIHVVGITYPIVPRDQARLRFFITSEHSETQIKEALNITHRVIQKYLEVSHA